MFTGIITHAAAITTQRSQPDGLTLTFAKPSDWTDLELGESVATNGVCLTVAAIRKTEYDCQLIAETLNVTTFGQQIPQKVNLERALRTGDRLSGHFVQGHVDDVGQVTQFDRSTERLTVSFAASHRPNLIYKGSITIDGVALTIVELTGKTFSVALVPHTLQHTTLGELQVDEPVNLEFDMLGKYILNRPQ